MKPIYQSLLDGIPDYKVFLTVDEMDSSSEALAQQYPDVVSIFEMGKTREGHPLLCLKIGEGSQNALLFGLPHPNEPIGTMMLEYFTRALAESKELRDELDFTFYVVKAWDADGAKMNEQWYKGPYSIRNYVRNFYRPAGFEQVDWTFPVDYKELHFHDTLPETRAMMNLIDSVKPRFIYSLHNAGFGGVYWYMTAPTREIFPDLHGVPARYGVPVHMGEPESPSCIELAPAIYQNLGVCNEYDYMEKYGGVSMAEYAPKMKMGDCSASYALERYNSFTLLTELPYFYDPRIEDLSTSEMTRKAAVTKKTEEGIAQSKNLLEAMAISKQYFSPDNHFMLAINSFNENAEENAVSVYAMMDADPSYDKPATVAEVFDNLLISKFYHSLSVGMLVRANESELQKMEKNAESDPKKKAALEAGRNRALEEYAKITDYLEEHMQYQVVPIKNLVGIQLECGLRVAEYLKLHPEI